MSSASASGGASAGRRPLTIIVAVIGVIGIIVGALYLFDGGALPSFMIAGSHVKGGGNHLIRGLVSVVVGAALLFFAWRSSKSAASKN